MFHIINFEVNSELIVENNITLSDTIRIAFHDEDPSLFSILNYSSDCTFLEPSLFYHFLSNIDNEDKISLLQSVLGYIQIVDESSHVSFKSDCFGIVNIPNLGYIRSAPRAEIQIDIQLLDGLISNRFVINSKIRLCLHPTGLLSNIKDIFFNESIEETLKKNEHTLAISAIFFQKFLPDFWNLIESVTREFVVFSSPNYNSFAGIMHHGTAYFNTENKLQTPVFFIDDIAHQCGHIIFNVLTLDTPKYLRVSKDHPLKNYSSNPGEMRGAYGAFYGLFTYTCILHALDHVIQSQYFTNEDFNFEALGRIGFYLSKFYLDLQLMNNPEILTEEGLGFHRQFQEGFTTMAEKYGKVIGQFNFNNQPYTFQYDRFLILNSREQPYQYF